MQILPTQSIYYKNSIFEKDFDPTQNKPVLVSTVSKGNIRPDVINSLDELLTSKDSFNLINGKVLRYENLMREALFFNELLPKYGA